MRGAGTGTPLVLGALLGVAAGSLLAQQPAPIASTWGYVEKLEGRTLTLDDGTALELPEAVTITNLQGEPGTLEDVTRGLRALATFAGDGSVEQVELLSPPRVQELYLTKTTTWGANVVAANVQGRVYPRSLATTRATFALQYNWNGLTGSVAYQPPADGGAAPEARFAVLGTDAQPMFEQVLRPGETAAFRLSFAPGTTTAVTLTAGPVGEGALQAEWCLWLDPHLVVQPAAGGTGPILVATAAQLVADLRRALGDETTGPLAVAQFGVVRLNDDQALKDFQEDLVLAAANSLPVAGKLPRVLELGVPLPDDAKQQLNELGATGVLVGTVSSRGALLVVSAALVNVETGAIIATARATQ